MRKLSPAGVNVIILSIMGFLLIIAGISIYLDHRQSSEPGQDILILHSDRGMSVDMEPEEEILVEIMAKDYYINFEYLLRASIDGEQVGIVYFDKYGEIQFEGDKERFEYAILRAFEIREESWGYKNEKK